MIVMRKNASWTNRTVGMTDAGHNAMSVNPRLLQADNNNGTSYTQSIHTKLYRACWALSLLLSLQVGESILIVSTFLVDLSDELAL